MRKYVTKLSSNTFTHLSSFKQVLLAWRKEVAKLITKHQSQKIPAQDNNASGSRKPHQRTVDCASQGILLSGVASRTRSSLKRMNPSYINESNEGDTILNKVRVDDESIERMPRPDKGKGLANELGADVKTSSGKRKFDTLRGNKVTRGSASRHNIPSSLENMPPRRINEMDDRGKRIWDESSDYNSDSSNWSDDYCVEITEGEFRSRIEIDIDSDDSSYWSGDFHVETSDEDLGSRIEIDIDSDDSSYWSGDSHVETSDEDLGSRMKELQNAKKLKSRAQDVLAPESSKRETRLRSSSRIKDNANKLNSRSKDVSQPKTTRMNYRGDKLFESGVPLPEVDYYFVIQVEPRRMNELRIPMDFNDDDNLTLPETIKLVDPKNRIFSAKLTTWKDGRKAYIGGMGPLCRLNGLTGNDYCICMFGEGDQEGFLFLSFVRKATP